ncbi:MAG: c-type cytochrome [Planctomycetes bacterium]|nr:c-type cytochrome [Planctomycetota bacterium]
MPRRSLASVLFALLVACTVAAPALAPAADAPAAFAFQKGDVVAVYGNGLADRMQHAPWVEAVLQGQLQGLEVRFRDMGVSGDTVAQRPRSQGFMGDPFYLALVDPDVIFMFFGYNESYDGPGGAEAYERQLVEAVEKMRTARADKGTDCRFVLFSPIAFEDAGDRNLPDGSWHNPNLAAYAEATRRAAGKAGATFVDLYGPTYQLFASSPVRLTLNGCHLNDAGYRKLADIVSQALLGKSVAADTDLGRLYAAVADKNWCWHNRFRATDGNDIWGNRSGLTFVNGQSNADVLKHELVMLDVMTANRDPAIWAAAAGRPVTVDDGNVPAPVSVISNVGGRSSSSSAEKEGFVEYLSPEDSRRKIKVPDGFELNVFASEQQFPDLANPVQLQVDAKGRLWAACWNTYPKWEPLQPMNDSLMILEDADRDGRADKRTIFANVHNPLGFEFWGKGVIVTSGPDLLYLEDTDGDDKADVRTILLQGLGTEDTHHAANNLIYGPDGGIYWQSGIFLVHNHETPWVKNLNVGASGMYRFNPRRFSITPHAGNSPNPHGTSFDEWGYCYANDGTGGNSFQVRPEGTGFRMHKLLETEFRPVAADEILSSEHFPDDMQQDFLICNTIGFLGVKQYDLDRDGEEGRRKPGEVWGTPVRPLLESEDRNFRPTDAVVGADGALYVADWHNVIIGHMQHNIRDPNRDHAHGRIFRLTATGRPLQPPVAIHGQPIAALLKNLEHPVNGVRHRSRVELSGRPTADVIAATKAWMKDFNPDDPQQARHLLEALWLHQQHEIRDDNLTRSLLASKVPHAAIAAATVKHFWHDVDQSGAGGFFAAPEQEVVMFDPPGHLSESDRKAYELGAAIYQREAHCMTCHQAHGKGMGLIYPTLVGSPWVLGSEERLVKTVLHGLWGPMTVNGQSFDPARGVPPMTAFRALLKDDEVAALLTFVRNTWGNKASAVSPDLIAKVRAATASRSTFWNPDELLAAHPMENELASAATAAAAEVVDNTALEAELLAADPTELATVARARGDLERGRRLFFDARSTCYTCHEPPGGAGRLGPNLAERKTSLTDVEIVESILHPSKRISKEYGQVTAVLDDGKQVAGIRVEENDREIVLRDLLRPEPVRIPHDTIDELIESPVSLMPANLVRLLKSRREFNDLLRYVLETRSGR